MRCRLRKSVLRVFRRQTYRATPWKNGGGITHEVVRSPEGEVFDWRVSVARIERPGPFSDFPSHVRHMALLEGDGVRLRFDDRERTLSRVGELVDFDGAAAVHCELLGGSCTDLNLMVAKHLSARVAILPLTAVLKIAPLPGKTQFLFNVGPPVRVACGSESYLLGSWDSILLEGAEAEVGAVAAGPDDAPSVVFFATIWHGRES